VKEEILAGTCHCSAAARFARSPAALPLGPGGQSERERAEPTSGVLSSRPVLPGDSGRRGTGSRGLVPVRESEGGTRQTLSRCRRDRRVSDQIRPIAVASTPWTGTRVPHGGLFKLPPLGQASWPDRTGKIAKTFVQVARPFDRMETRG